MSQSTSTTVPPAEKDDEGRATLFADQDVHSSDMEIDEDYEKENDRQASSTRNEDICTNYEDSKYPIFGKQPAKEKTIQGFVVSQKAAQVVLERKAPENHYEHHSNNKSHLVINKIMNEAANPSTVAGKEVVTSILVRHHSGVNCVTGFEEKSKQMDVHLEDDKRRIKSRSATQQNSAGSVSADPEFNRGNKHPALICDFFARGWCIKGSSCRFLHIKDGENSPRKQSEEDVDASNGKKAVHVDEGFRNAAERSRSLGSTDTQPSSVGNRTELSSHFFSERVPPLGDDENQRLNTFHEISVHRQSKDKSMGTSLASQQFSASKDDLGPPKGVRQNSVGQNFPADNYTKPALLSHKDGSTFRNSFLPECKSTISGSVTSLGNRYSENQAYHVSTWKGSLPLGSLSACSFGAQKVLLDSDRERQNSRLSSLLQSSSPLSRCEYENFPLNNISRDPLHFADYKIKISSDDWEPSVPFRPSFFVTSCLPSPRSQYDRLRDGMDMSNPGGRFLKFSFSSQGPSLQNVAYPPTYGDSTSTGPVIPECNDDKNTTSSNRYHETLVNNTCYTSGKDSITTDANDGTSSADMENGTLAKEEISSVASHAKDISKTKKVDADNDGSHQRDGVRCKNDLKIDRARENNEKDVRHKADGKTFKESKAMRHFHAALVDLIKELLKPAWREGHLSKDAHNTIVRKAVDKVFGTIQPHQAPITIESVQQYLSLSQPKIAKLVEGYIDKYKNS